MSIHTASYHEVTLLQLNFDFHMIEAKLNNVIGDRAYDNQSLDEQFAPWALQ